MVLEHRKPLKRKREERGVVDFRIILVLHCNELLKQALNF